MKRRKSIPCTLLATVLVLFFFQNAKAQWHLPIIPGVLPNSAVNLGENCFEITSGGTMRGVVWDSAQIDLSRPFDITLSVNQQPWGADGIALVMQASGLNSWGAGANALGFGDAVPPAAGYGPILPSIAFELDTWENGPPVADIIPDHVAIHINGNMTATVAGPVPALAGGANVTDGLCHTLRVTWDPLTTRINIFFDSNPVPRISTLYDMVNLVFGGNPIVWWGITGASGGMPMTQIVCIGGKFTNAGIDRTVCESDTVHLQASGATTYSWTPGPPLLSNASIANPIFGSAPPSTYTVWVQGTNDAGCTSRDTVYITVEPKPVAIPGPAGSVCLGDSLQLGGASNPNYSYNWSPGSNLSGTTVAGPWCTPTSPGLLNYTLVVIDVSGTAGCNDTANVVITALDTPSVAIAVVNGIICAGDSASLTATPAGGTLPYSFAWSNMAVTAAQSVSPAVTSNFVVTVTDANGCITSATAGVVVNDTPTVTVAANPSSVCPGQSTTLTATLSGGGAAPYSYLWSSGGLSPVEIISPAVSGAYGATATDANGCQGSGMVMVVVNPSESVDITVSDTTICSGGAVNVTNTFSTPGINTWTWSPTTGVSSVSSPNPTISPMTTQTYYLYAVNSLTGCGHTDSLRITVNNQSAPIVNLGADTSICLGNSLTLNAGNPGFGYLWSTGGSGQQIIATVGGWYSVVVFDTVGCGFSVTDSLFLGINPLPQPQLGPDTTICPGSSLTLGSGLPGIGYWWNTGSSAPSIVVTTQGLYICQLTDSNGCIGTDTITVMFSPPIIASITGLASTYCQTDPAVALLGSPPGGMFSGSASGAGIFSPALSGPGSHNVTYQFVDAFGCVFTDSQGTLVVQPPSVANAGPDISSFGAVTLGAFSPAVGTGSWYSVSGIGFFSGANDPNANVSGLDPGIHALVWMVQNPPCPANRDTVLVLIEGVVIPTGFSPNGDGINDNYVINGIEGFDAAKLMVFNRWGNLVFTSDNYQNDWSGTNNSGNALSDDTYYVIVELGKQRAYNTFVVLKR